MALILTPFDLRSALLGNIVIDTIYYTNQLVGHTDWEQLAWPATPTVGISQSKLSKP